MSSSESVGNVGGEVLERALWENTRDSLRHAIDHFSSLSGAGDNRGHHAKWAILSVHHAAECFCHMKLVAVRTLAGATPESLFRRNGRTWYPSLRQTLDELGQLQGAEAQLLALFRVLADERDQIMHRTLPTDLDASVAAMSSLGILRLLPRWVGKSTADILRQYPPPETDVFESISYKRVEEYCRLAEHLLKEEYPDEWLPWCPACETQSVLGSRCGVCFEDMDYLDCPNTNERAYFPSWMRRANAVEVVCPHCEEIHREHQHQEGPA